MSTKKAITLFDVADHLLFVYEKLFDMRRRRRDEHGEYIEKEELICSETALLKYIKDLKLDPNKEVGCIDIHL